MSPENNINFHLTHILHESCDPLCRAKFTYLAQTLFRLRHLQTLSHIRYMCTCGRNFIHTLLHQPGKSYSNWKLSLHMCGDKFLLLK